MRFWIGVGLGSMVGAAVAISAVSASRDSDRSIRIDVPPDSWPAQVTVRDADGRDVAMRFWCRGEFQRGVWLRGKWVGRQ